MLNIRNPSRHRSLKLAPVVFTQDVGGGRKRHVTIMRPEDIAKMARTMNAAGVAFWATYLPTGQVHLSAVWRDRAIASAFVLSDTGLTKTVDRFIGDANHAFLS